MFRQLPMFYYLTDIESFSYIATATANTNSQSLQNKASID